MDTTLFLIVFGVASAVVIPLLWKFARRSSHPHLRPRLGEVLLVAIIAFGFAGGAAAGISTLLSTDRRAIENLRSTRPNNPQKKKDTQKRKATVIDSDSAVLAGLSKSLSPAQ